ncbi:hypothetical protein JCM17843_31600 [Kordiimonadales bacterium JCM 17843]|nr:hypothetical protein JCM17843_31600 [Kordiimonadales bacterium JCM 17843]
MWQILKQINRPFVDDDGGLIDRYGGHTITAILNLIGSTASQQFDSPKQARQGDSKNGPPLDKEVEKLVGSYNTVRAFGDGIEYVPNRIDHRDVDAKKGFKAALICGAEL